ACNEQCKDYFTLVKVFLYFSFYEIYIHSPYRRIDVFENSRIKVSTYPYHRTSIAYLCIILLLSVSPVLSGFCRVTAMTLVWSYG
ncbi:Os09g0520550, partial [Oryza sativa Japonica Group]